MEREKELALMRERARLAQELAYVTERLAATQQRLDAAAKARREATEWFAHAAQGHDLPFRPDAVGLRNFGGCYEAFFDVGKARGTFLRIGDGRVHARMLAGDREIARTA